MAQGIYDKLEETLKLLTALNKQLCCEPAPPPTTTTTTEPPEFLRLLFNSIENTPVVDPTNINDWNTFFFLPLLENPFTSVQVVGNEVRLFGGSNIYLNDDLFDSNSNLLEFVDNQGFITIGGRAFTYCSSLTTVYLPQVTSIIGEYFRGCTSINNIYLPLCTDFGGTVGNDDVFNAVSGNNITLTIPSSLMTADSGNPDGDIVYLQANNTVTIITV